VAPYARSSQSSGRNRATGRHGLPLVGTLAGIGLILYFIGAILTHVRARDNAFGLPTAFLLIVVVWFVLDLVSSRLTGVSKRNGK
jgi:DoxX-like family